MRAFVGVTDGEWYRYLATRHSSEVNFWRPSSTNEFRALTPGEPFLFKSHYPHNRLVGGGFYSGFARLHISEAWDLLGESNGAASLHDMRRQVGRYRKQPLGPRDDPVIGCIFVRDTVFFPFESPSEPPPRFSPNLVQGKGYDLASVDTGSYFEDGLARLLGHAVEFDLSEPWHREGRLFGDPRVLRGALARRPFRRWCSMLTVADVLSLVRGSDRCFKRHIYDP